MFYNSVSIPEQLHQPFSLNKFNQTMKLAQQLGKGKSIHMILKYSAAKYGLLASTRSSAIES
jgi:hypothetical protein